MATELKSWKKLLCLVTLIFVIQTHANAGESGEIKALFPGKDNVWYSIVVIPSPRTFAEIKAYDIVQYSLLRRSELENMVEGKTKKIASTSGICETLLPKVSSSTTIASVITKEEGTISFHHSSKYGDVLGWETLTGIPSFSLGKNGTWSQPIQPSFSGNGQIIYDNDGNLHFAWIDYSKGRTYGILETTSISRVMYGSFDGRKYTTPLEISPLMRGACDVRLGANENGDLILLAWVEDKLFFCSKPKGYSWSTPLEISNGRFDSSPELLIIDDGFYFSTYQEKILGRAETGIIVVRLADISGIIKKTITITGQNPKLLKFCGMPCLLYFSKSLEILFLDKKELISKTINIGQQIQRENLKNIVVGTNETHIAIGLNYWDTHRIQFNHEVFIWEGKRFR